MVSTINFILLLIGVVILTYVLYQVAHRDDSTQTILRDYMKSEKDKKEEDE